MQLLSNKFKDVSVFKIWLIPFLITCFLLGIFYQNMYAHKKRELISKNKDICDTMYESLEQRYKFNYDLSLKNLSFVSNFILKNSDYKDSLDNFLYSFSNFTKVEVLDSKDLKVLYSFDNKDENLNQSISKEMIFNFKNKSDNLCPLEPVFKVWNQYIILSNTINDNNCVLTYTNVKNLFELKKFNSGNIHIFLYDKNNKYLDSQNEYKINLNDIKNQNDIINDKGYFYKKKFSIYSLNNKSDLQILFFNPIFNEELNRSTKIIKVIAFFIFIIFNLISWTLIQRKIQIQEIKELLKNNSYIDNLTTFKNRNAYYNDFGFLYYTSRVRRKSLKAKFAILEIKISNLEMINDNFGFEIGNKYLIQISNILKSYPNIEKYRFSGKVFMLIARLDSNLEWIDLTSKIISKLTNLDINWPCNTRPELEFKRNEIF